MTSLTTGLVLKVLFLSFNSYKATLTLLIKYSTASEGVDGWVRTYAEKNLGAWQNQEYFQGFPGHCHYHSEWRVLHVAIAE